MYIRVLTHYITTQKAVAVNEIYDAKQLTIIVMKRLPGQAHDSEHVRFNLNRPGMLRGHSVGV
jgi:hypothetical protein